MTYFLYSILPCQYLAVPGHMLSTFISTYTVYFDLYISSLKKIPLTATLAVSVCHKQHECLSTNTFCLLQIFVF